MAVSISRGAEMTDTTYDFRYTPTYLDCVRSYRGRSDVKGALAEALEELAISPFGNPRLQSHAVHGAPEGTFTSYVDRRGRRLIWRLVGRVIVLLLFGEHDAVYRRAERLRLQIDDTQNVVRVFDEDRTEQVRPYDERRSAEGTLFMAWNDRELVDFGFQEQEISVLRHLHSEDDLLALEHRMREQTWQSAINLVMYGNTSGKAPDTLGNVAPMVEPPSASPDSTKLEAALLDERAHREFVPVPADQLAEILSRPIEDWMVYLDPSQDTLVSRRLNGPGRIRGAAGTGKTVVALHRARRIASQHDDARVLFATFVANLPRVYGALYERLSPETASRVEFNNVHRWASAFLHRRRIHLNVDTRAYNRAWKAACDALLVAGNPLQRAGLTRTYLKEEVDWLIKGRGLNAIENYLHLQRSGRGTPLGSRLREHVWALYERYQCELTARRAHDFNDILLRALDEIRDHGFDRSYDAIIVDEAQDLTEASIRLLHAATGDSADGLLLVGDGQQSIYPGGFCLADLGIQVRGRSFVLTRNYRNTRQVLATANALVSSSPFDDGEAGLEPGARTVEVVRDGAEPQREGFPTADDHDIGLCTAIEAVVDTGTGPGDVAVLVPTNALVKQYANRIAEIGLPTQQMEDYDGIPNSMVKVGTYQRAKGLEFKHVLLPRLDSDGVGDARRRGEDDETYKERLGLLRRQLFVAMTRARDGLWLGWVDRPSSLLGRDQLDGGTVLDSKAGQAG